MTKIRCHVCGGEDLHTEGSIFVVCNDCGNRSFVIPESAVVNWSNPADNDIATIQYNRKGTDCPRRSFCLNDTMQYGQNSCQTCKVVEHRLEELADDMLKSFNEMQTFLKKHPEFANKL